MTLHPITKRAIKHSAYYATIISAIGLVFELISILSFYLTLIPISIVMRMISWVLLMPSTLIYGFVFDPFPNLSWEVMDCVSAGTSLVVYFGLFWLTQIAYHRIRESLHTNKPAQV
jgi:hypothetical protein